MRLAVARDRDVRRMVEALLVSPSHQRVSVSSVVSERSLDGAAWNRGARRQLGPGPRSRRMLMSTPGRTGRTLPGTFSKHYDRLEELRRERTEQLKARVGELREAGAQGGAVVV